MIRDKGVGIPRENLSKIFDPYFTTKEKKERGGIGLGLAICDSIIKYHNGLITVESLVGVGTTFFIYLAATPDGIPKS
jgi:two-component system, cell cycle sensor histidine kinase and response regulator CckA